MQVTRRQWLVSSAGALWAGSAPSVPFGAHRISRLIVGGNPVSGNSHWSPEIDREMADYFSAANVKKLLAACEKAGINTWQSRADRHIMRLLREYRNEGGRINGSPRQRASFPISSATSGTLPPTAPSASTITAAALTPCSARASWMT